MKKVTMMALVFIAMTYANAVLAGQPEATDAKVRITSYSEQKKVVIRVFNGSEHQNAVLKIKDAKGRQVHAETIRSPMFIRAYDFSKTPGETYTVEVRTKEGTTTRTFEIKDESATALYFKPVVKTEPGLIGVIFKNPLPSSVFLRLYDQTGKVVYQTIVPSQELYSAGLNVSRLPNQPYLLSLRSNEYSYKKHISAY